HRGRLTVPHGVHQPVPQRGRHEPADGERGGGLRGVVRDAVAVVRGCHGQRTERRPPQAAAVEPTVLTALAASRTRYRPRSATGRSAPLRGVALSHTTDRPELAGPRRWLARPRACARPGARRSPPPRPERSSRAAG